MDECPAPAPEINLPLDGTEAAGATDVPPVSPSLRSGEGRQGKGPRARIPWHRPGEGPFKGGRGDCRRRRGLRDGGPE